MSFYKFGRKSLDKCGFNTYWTEMTDKSGRHQGCGGTMDGGLDCAFCDRLLLSYDENNFQKYAVGHKCQCGAVISSIDDRPFDISVQY